MDRRSPFCVLRVHSTLRVTSISSDWPSARVARGASAKKVLRGRMAAACEWGLSRTKAAWRKGVLQTRTRAGKVELPGLSHDEAWEEALRSFGGSLKRHDAEQGDAECRATRNTRILQSKTTCEVPRWLIILANNRGWTEQCSCLGRNVCTCMTPDRESVGGLTAWLPSRPRFDISVARSQYCSITCSAQSIDYHTLSVTFEKNFNARWFLEHGQTLRKLNFHVPEKPICTPAKQNYI